jgi:predicted ATPase/DNA-binding SARP family transcriptional activator
MATLTLNVLGPLQVMRDGTQLSRFRSDKVRALLAYLAVEAEQPHSRASLCGLLWPDHSDQAALQNLSQTLLRLREALGDQRSGESVLHISRRAIQWNAASGCQLDLADFVRLAASADRAALEQAVALYRGPFLAGFSIPGCANFDEWLLLWREHAQRLVLQALDTLAQRYLAAGAYAQAEAAARRQLELDPLREPAYRSLMLALTGRGERTAALNHFERGRQLLQAELGVEPEEETRILYQRIRGGEVALVQPPAKAPPHNLPKPLTPFVGRERELAELSRRLRTPELRLLTLVGPGGMGKTRLALELAHRQLEQFADGVFFVSLAPLTAASAIVPTITAALGIGTHDGPHPGDGRSALLEALRPKQLLLVLDNFEHLLDGAEIVVAMLQAAPEVQIVATSRARLNVYGEHPYVVEGLAFAPADSVAAAKDYAAIQLFVGRARLVQAGFRLSETNLPSVLRICQLVEGMPLGLELAATWAELLAPTEIADEIAQSVDFLSSNLQDLPARQRSMRAVFEWSWRLLNAQEQQVFRRLAVFRGGFTREAALAVADASLGVLTSLLRKALLRAHVADGTAGRYELHELLRQFALEQLNAMPEEYTRVAGRHATYFLGLVETVVPKLAGAEQSIWLQQLECDHDNLRAALFWAWKQGDLTLGLLLAGALWPFWRRRSHLSEGRRWLEGFLASEEASGVAPEVRAMALHGAGWLAHDQDDYLRADALFSEGLALDREQGHSGRVAAVLAHRGMMARAQGQYAQALALVEQSLALARAAQDPSGTAYALFRLGLIARERGEYVRAEAIYRECLAAYEALGDRSGTSFALIGLADIACDQGDAAGVEAWCAESLALGRTLGKHWVVGFSLNILALAAMMSGDLERAAMLAEEAWAVFRANEIHSGVVSLLITHGQIACASGEYAQAQALLVEALKRGWPGGPHWLVVTGLEELTRVELAAGKAARAAQLYAAAVCWRSQMEAPLQPYRRAALDATLAAARAALGEQAFAAAWAEGSAWPPEQAIAVALNDTDRSCG